MGNFNYKAGDIVFDRYFYGSKDFYEVVKIYDEDNARFKLQKGDSTFITKKEYYKKASSEETLKYKLQAIFYK